MNNLANVKGSNTPEYRQFKRIKYDTVLLNDFARRAQALLLDGPQGVARPLATEFNITYLQAERLLRVLKLKAAKGHTNRLATTTEGLESELERTLARAGQLRNALDLKTQTTTLLSIIKEANVPSASEPARAALRRAYEAGIDA